MFAISLACPGPVLGFIGMVDWALAAILLAGIVQQAQYMPMSHSDCREVESWRLGGSGRNFFVEAFESGRFDETATSPKAICVELVTNKDVTIAVV